jgi:hypothetical protein
VREVSFSRLAILTPLFSDQVVSFFDDVWSQVLGAFALLDFTIIRPVLAWRAF